MKKITINNLTHRSQVSLFEYWRIIDSIEEFSASFEEGSINGIIGELGHGGWLLSAILCGKIIDETLVNTITISGMPSDIESLRRISCYVGEGVAEAPYRKLQNYPGKIMRKIIGVKTVMEHIREGVIKSKSKLSAYEIAEMFELTGISDNDEKNGRINRPLEFQSGEVWRATMAIGVAYKKKLFCFPWLEPEFIAYVLSNHNQKYIERIRDIGGTIIIPVSNIGYFNNKIDQTIFLKKPKNRI